MGITQELRVMTMLLWSKLWVLKFRKMSKIFKAQVEYTNNNHKEHQAFDWSNKDLIDH